MGFRGSRVQIPPSRFSSENAIVTYDDGVFACLCGVPFVVRFLPQSVREWVPTVQNEKWGLNVRTRLGLSRCVPMNDESFAGFASAAVDTGETHIHVRHGGSGPAVLLLHGFPETH